MLVSIISNESETITTQVQNNIKTPHNASNSAVSSDPYFLVIHSHK